MCTLVKITLAATNVSEMVAFYNAVLNAGLVALETMPDFYRGRLGSVTLIVCPNEVAGVDATQNRQQLCFAIDGLTSRVEAGLQNGGKLMSTNSNETHYYLIDPDGNTLELMEAD